MSHRGLAWSSSPYTRGHTIIRHGYVWSRSTKRETKIRKLLAPLKLHPLGLLFLPSIYNRFTGIYPSEPSARSPRFGQYAVGWQVCHAFDMPRSFRGVIVAHLEALLAAEEKFDTILNFNLCTCIDQTLFCALNRTGIKCCLCVDKIHQSVPLAKM